MGKLVVVNHVTLDGVMQSPGGPDEDTRGGFEHGGWAVPYTDDVQIEYMTKGIDTSGKSGRMVFGRRTYEKFFDYWPKQKDNPFTEVLNNSQKYVASTTLSEPLPWENSTLLSGDVADAVARLKQEFDGHLTILGSGELIRTLMRRHLIDEFVLTIHPLVLGSGMRMFGDEGTRVALELIDSKPTTTGVLIATYRAA